MAEFSFKKLINGYEPREGHGEDFFSRGITGYMNKRGHHKVARALTVVGDKLSQTMACTSTRSYGVFLTSFGLLTLMIHYAKDYLNGGGTVSPYVFVVGIVFSLLGIPFLIFDKPISIAFSEFSLTDYIFFEFFCIKRTPMKPGMRGLNSVVALTVGVALAILGGFVPLWTVVLGISCAVYLFLTFTSPEFSYFLIFLCLPYFNLINVKLPILTILVAVTLLSYARKVLLGKRFYYFEQYDLILFALLGLFLTAGVFMKGMDSFTNSLVMVTLAMGYVLTNSLCTNGRLADCVSNAVVISSVPAAAYSVYIFVRSLTEVGIDGVSGVTLSFHSSKTLALFLIVSAVLAFYLALTHRNRGGRAVYVVFLVIICLATVTTLEIWAPVVLFIGFLGYGAAKLRRYPGFALGTLGALPYALVALPKTVMNALSSLPVLSSFHFDQYALRWSNSLKIFKSSFFTGIGIGEDSFMSEYSAFDGPLFEDSGCFLLEVGVESGIFALLFLIILLAVRLRHLNKYRRYVEESTVKMTSVFSSVAVLCMVVYGAMNYVWSDINMYYLFWCIMGVGSACLRISKAEYDDRIDYYSDGSSAHSSSIDVLLSD